MFGPVHPQSVVMITLDSCRYDTFASAAAPNLKSIGTLHRAMSPGSFTYASHAAMFVGFTPGDASVSQPFINPKFGKIFRMAGVGFPSKTADHIILEGRNIIDGFKHKGYMTIGSGAVAWFDPSRPTSRALTADFHEFFYGGEKGALASQLAFVESRMNAAGKNPVFVFLNVGETHVPYYHQGASWDAAINPCLPFAQTNDAAECRRRQKACVEFADKLLGPLLEAFSRSTILACADHGDCWGEDGLWEHGIHHPKVFEVPLLFRLARP